jgi:hypothetical protein
MAYQEIKTEGYGQRVGGSFKGMVAALVLLAAGTYLLWYNEGRSVATGDAIAEARMAAEELPDVGKLDPTHNGKMIHATGFADTKDVLTDPIFGVMTTAIRLDRKAEYYQWVENSSSKTQKKLGGGTETVTTYTYSQQWINKPVDSSAFHDPAYVGKNSVRTTVPNETFYAGDVTFGAYRLPSFIINSISGAVPLTVNLTSEDIENLNRQMIHQEVDPVNAGLETVVDNVALSQTGLFDYVHVQSNVIYLGRSPTAPRNGDVRVTFTEVKPANISILAQVIGDTFEPFRASNGNTFSRLAMGTVGAENMFGDAVSGNNTLTWILRAVGALVVFTALKMFMAPLSVLADVIPILGTIVGAGTGLVAFLIGLAWSLIVIAAAWLRFRPVIGGSLLGGAAVLLALLYVKGRKTKTA